MRVILGIDSAAQHIAAIEITCIFIFNILQLVDVVDQQRGRHRRRTIARVGCADLILVRVTRVIAQLVSRRARAVDGHTGGVCIGRAVDVKGRDFLVVVLGIVRCRSAIAGFYTADGSIDAVGRIVIAIDLLCIGVDADTVDALHDGLAAVIAMRDDDLAVVVGIAVGADVNLAAHAGSTDAYIEALLAHRSVRADVCIVLGRDLRGRSSRAALDIDIALGDKMDAVRVAVFTRGVDGDGIVLRVDAEGLEIRQHSADTDIDGRAALNLDITLFTAVDNAVFRIISRGINAEATDVDLGAVHEDDAVRVNQGHVACRIEFTGDFRHAVAAHSIDEQVGAAVLLDIDRRILADVECIPADKGPTLAFILIDCHYGFCFITCDCCMT